MAQLNEFGNVVQNGDDKEKGTDDIFGIENDTRNYLKRHTIIRVAWRLVLKAPLKTSKAVLKKAQGLLHFGFELRLATEIHIFGQCIVEDPPSRPH